MKNLLFALLLFCSAPLFSQFYYADIMGTRQTNQQYQLLQSLQLKRVTASGFEANNEPSKDFLLEQQLNTSKQQIITRSATIGTGESIFTSSFQSGLISRTYDSGASAINTVEYKYDTQGKLISTLATNKDFDGLFSSTELHTWHYNPKGQPVQMLKIKNGTDTTFVNFVLDEFGNVAEEIWKKNNRVLETYYYYFNNKQQLTDIVRYNRKAKQLLPDYMFEYDAEGRIFLMTQAQAATANYLIYRYTYNDRGLKEKEQVYNKKKEFLGKIEYSYQ